jgi:large subunit ribosomal protein L18
MSEKRAGRLRRRLRTRMKIREMGIHRLCIHRTPRHIYAQVIAPSGSEVVAAASTVQAVVRQGLRSTGDISAARAVGKAIAEKAKALGVERVAFDRSGFKYHGRVRALAESAREHGLQF